jgi:hypothetical protein
MSTPLESPQTDRRLGTLTEERVQPSFSDGDHERFAHYVVKDKLTDAISPGPR